MIVETKEFIEDFTVITEKGESKNETLAEGLIKEDYIGFVFYEKGNARIFDTTGKELGDKQPCHWSAFSVAKEHGNIIRRTPANTYLSKLTVLYPMRYLKNKITPSLKKQTAWHRLFFAEDVFVSISQKIASEDLVNPVLKVLGCSYTGNVRSLFIESQCLEILSLMIMKLSLEDPNEALTTLEIEKLELAQKILIQNFQNPPTLKILSRKIGLNSLKLKTGFKKLFGKPPYTMLREYRLNYAYTKLMTRNYTVSEVAELTGYESTTSFSKAFYAHFNIQPKTLK
jgi:AraC family transcriptional regulator, transcriptional activator of the genes for pyochelin and ferripyochelin receptors